jgi:hypothetical protein
LHFVEEAFGEKRAAGAVAQARGEDFLLGRAAFALEVAAGETAGRGIFFAVIDGEREEVLAGLMVEATEAATKTMVSPTVTVTAPLARFAMEPVPMVSPYSGTETVCF